MSVRDRVIDARLLIRAERWEGALTSVLLAVAATSRKRFPKGTASRWNPDKSMADREAFETYLDSDLWKHTKLGALRGAAGVLVVEFRGEAHKFEHILYKYVRCELVHEGGLPVDVEFVGEAKNDGDLVVDLPANDGAPMRLSRTWLRPLLLSVVCAAENKGLFDDDAPF